MSPEQEAADRINRLRAQGYRRYTPEECEIFYTSAFRALVDLIKETRK